MKPAAQLALALGVGALAAALWLRASDGPGAASPAPIDDDPRWLQYDDLSEKERALLLFDGWGEMTAERRHARYARMAELERSRALRALGRSEIEHVACVRCQAPASVEPIRVPEIDLDRFTSPAYKPRPPRARLHRQAPLCRSCRGAAE